MRRRSIDIIIIAGVKSARVLRLVFWLKCMRAVCGCRMLFYRLFFPARSLFYILSLTLSLTFFPLTHSASQIPDDDFFLDVLHRILLLSLSLVTVSAAFGEASCWCVHFCSTYRGGRGGNHSGNTDRKAQEDTTQDENVTKGVRIEGRRKWRKIRGGGRRFEQGELQEDIGAPGVLLASRDQSAWFEQYQETCDELTRRAILFFDCIHFFFFFLSTDIFCAYGLGISIDKDLYPWLTRQSLVLLSLLVTRSDQLDACKAGTSDSRDKSGGLALRDHHLILA